MFQKTVIIIGKRSNLSIELKKHMKESIIIKTDDFITLEKALIMNENISIIYNSCIKSSKLNSTSDPLVYTNYSINFLSEFIKYCITYKTKINSIIFTSSSAIYGNNKRAKEEDEYQPVNLYSSFKISSELLISRYLERQNIKLIFARIFNMYGGNDQFSVVNSIFNSILKNQKFNVFNQGSSIRDFIYINDVCKLYKKIIYSDFQGNINICSGHGRSVLELIKSAEEILEKKLITVSSEVDEISVSIGCTDKLNREFGSMDYLTIESYLKMLKNKSTQNS